MSQFDRNRLPLGQKLYGRISNANSLQCPAPGCGKEFKSTGELQRHLIGAHGESRDIALARAKGVETPDAYKKAENADLPAYCYTCGVSLSMKESHGHRDKGHDVGAPPKAENTSDYLTEQWKSKLADYERRLEEMSPASGWDRMTLMEKIKEAKEILKKLESKPDLKNTKLISKPLSELAKEGRAAYGKKVKLKNAIDCPECGKAFARSADMAEHLVEDHGYTDDEAAQETGYHTRDRENSDMPPTEEELRSYHVKHHSGKFIECKECEKIATGEKSMKNDQVDPLHKNENASYKAECGHCGTSTEHDGKTNRCVVCGSRNERANANGQKTAISFKSIADANRAEGIISGPIDDRQGNVLFIPTSALEIVLDDLAADGFKKGHDFTVVGSY